MTKRTKKKLEIEYVIIISVASFFFTIISIGLIGSYYKENRTAIHIKIKRMLNPNYDKEVKENIDKMYEEIQAREEEKRQENIRIASQYAYPKPGLSYDCIEYTQMGKPHSIIKNNPGARYDLEAKWYFEDEQYEYYCGAYLYNIHRGGTYTASPDYRVQLFSAVGYKKGTNIYKKYTDGYHNDVNDFATGKYHTR